MAFASLSGVLVRHCVRQHVYGEVCVWVTIAGPVRRLFSGSLSEAFLVFAKALVCLVPTLPVFPFFTLRSDAFQTCLSVYWSKFRWLEMLDTCLIEGFWKGQTVEHSASCLFLSRQCSPNLIRRGGDGKVDR